MGFGFSTPDQTPRDTVGVVVRELVLEAFRRHGLDVTASGEAVLADRAGGRYSLVNLIHSCRYSERSEWSALIDQHARSMADAERAVDPTELPEAEFHSLLRERILPPNFASPMAEYSYCRPLVDGEPDSPLLASSLDYPDHVATLSDSKITGRDLAAAWSAGCRNTAAEKVDVHRGMGKDGTVIDVLGGNSMFIASKVADMQSLISDHVGHAPNGVVFAVFFWRDNVTTQVSDGRTIRAGGAFEATMTELMEDSSNN